MAKGVKDPIEVTEEKLDTLPKYFRRAYQQWGDRVAMRQKDYGIWHEYTWKECCKRAKHFGLGLLKLGAEPGDRVCFIGDCEVDLYWAMYGTWCIGGVAIGVWIDALPNEIQYYVTDSRAKFALVRDQEQIDKLLTIRSEIPEIKKVIWWEPKGMSASIYKDDPWIMGFGEVLESGRQYEVAHPTDFDECIDRGKPTDISAMYYTAGTTGAAKGVMRSNAGQIAIRKTMDLFWPMASRDNAAPMLSVASIAEPMMASTCNLMDDVVLNFAESPDTAEADSREVGFKLTGLTPRYYENIASKMRVRINDAGWLKRTIFNLSLPIGYKVARLEIEGKGVNPLWKVLRKLAWWLAFRPNLDKAGLLGLKWCTNSGFILGVHTFEFYRAIGVDIREFYCSTEVPAISAHMSGEIKLGSVGTLFEGVEARVSDKGEMLVRGAHRFDAYYNKPEKTAKAIDKDGWYHSGDAMHIDDDSFLFYIDRIDEMAQLRSGVKYSPQYVEAQMRFGAYIRDLWAVGEDRDFVVGITTIDFDSVSRWAEKHHVSFTTMVDLSQKDEVGELVLKDIQRVNKTLPEPVRIKKYIIMHKEFDPDEAELTRTKKLRRTYMYQKYGELAEAIYAGKELIPLEATFKYKDGRVGTVSADIKVREVSE